MKKAAFVLIILLYTSVLYSQSVLDSLVHAGVQYHDQGQYDKAIEAYKAALEIDPNSALVNYEISMTYMYAGDYESSIRHSDIVLEQSDQYLLPAYLTKGSCLDYLGRTEESIELFEKGIRKFDDHYLLHYNLGFNYYKMKEYDKAQNALVNAIENNPNHASSHLLLGYNMIDKGQKVQGLLCLHYFLFLEPNTERAKEAYATLRQQFGCNVKMDEDKPDQINIILNTEQAESEFGPAELMISLLEASKSLEENQGKSDEQLFIQNTSSFFTVLSELKNKKNKGLWWDFYVRFFNDISGSGHIATYCYYISQSSNEIASAWLKENRDKIDSFSLWLRER